MDVIVVAVATVLGLAMGSFANVPIHRWPLDQGVTEPQRSYCPACQSPIAARDNVPVLSWLLLRGRCRGCGASIHWRYPAVEVITAMLFAVVAWQIGPTLLLPAMLTITWALVVASAIDLEHRIIPNRLTYRLPFVLLVLLVPPTLFGPGDGSALLRACIAAVAVPLGVEALSQVYALVRGQRGFGLGDVKLLVSLGLVVGYVGGFELLVLIYAAIVASVVVAVVLMATGRAGLASRIPFGPYLAVGALVALLAGDSIRGPFLRLIGLE